MERQDGMPGSKVTLLAGTSTSYPDAPRHGPPCPRLPFWLADGRPDSNPVAFFFAASCIHQAAAAGGHEGHKVC